MYANEVQKDSTQDYYTTVVAANAPGRLYNDHAISDVRICNVLQRLALELLRIMFSFKKYLKPYKH